LSRGLTCHEHKCRGPGSIPSKNIAARNNRRALQAKAKAKAKARAKAKALPASAASNRTLKRTQERIRNARIIATQQGVSKKQPRLMVKAAAVLRRPAAYSERALKHTNTTAT